MSTTIASRLQGLGIQDLDKEIKQGTATVNDVMLIVRGRIEKRIRMGDKLIPKVCEYHDQLAEVFEKGTGIVQPRFSDKAPVYVKSSASLPDDPKEIANAVFAKVGPTEVCSVIAHLTARMAASI